MEQFDLAILGAGPGGYVAAIRAAQLGLKTALIERDLVGGTCLNWGCIPTKCWADIAHTIEKAKKASGQGVLFGPPQVDINQLAGWKDKVVTNLRNGIGYLLKNHGVNLVISEGALTPEGSIKTKDAEIKARTIILATGSSPARPKFFPFGDGRYITSDEIINLRKLPASLAVVGGGAIGCEFASIFAALGVKVSIFEMLPRLLPLEDSEVGGTMERIFKKRGVEVVIGRAAEKPELEKAELVLVAIGRQPNTGGIGLEEAGIATDGKGFVVTDDGLQTSVKNIFAIGDISGKGQLAYLASEHGVSIVERLAGHDHPVRDKFMPSCIFTMPEVGTFGLKEDDIKDRKDNYLVGKFPFTALGKAHCINETEGFVKIIAEKATGLIAGCQIIGPNAADLVHIASIAAAAEATLETITGTIFGHPTLAESVKEAAEACLGYAVHLPKSLK
ncbi:MAG: dihydrolipoyl dehydrogenase [Candidatus Omnitrophica bacterium]|nr:dihydrolipoyl dehydrogenase [Candidatus Omnitrophota bacterium]